MEKFLSATITSGDDHEEHIPFGFSLHGISFTICSRANSNETTVVRITVTSNNGYPTEDDEFDQEASTQSCNLCILSAAQPNFSTPLEIAGDVQVTFSVEGPHKVAISGRIVKNSDFEFTEDEDEDEGSDFGNYEYENEDEDDFSDEDEFDEEDIDESEDSPFAQMDMNFARGSRDENGDVRMNPRVELLSDDEEVSEVVEGTEDNVD